MTASFFPLPTLVSVARPFFRLEWAFLPLVDDSFCRHVINMCWSLDVLSLPQTLLYLWMGRFPSCSKFFHLPPQTPSNHVFRTQLSSRCNSPLRSAIRTMKYSCSDIGVVMLTSYILMFLLIALSISCLVSTWPLLLAPVPDPLVLPFAPVLAWA